MSNRNQPKKRPYQVRRAFQPFQQVVVPVFGDCVPEQAIKMAQAISADVRLLGLVTVPADQPLSSGNLAARKLRHTMEGLQEKYAFTGSKLVRVSYNCWEDLLAYTRQTELDLLILEWPLFFECLQMTPSAVLLGLRCNVAVLRGSWPEKPKRVLLPLRGGPYAQMALRLGISLPHDELTVLHLLSSDGLPSVIDAPFRGLARVIPNLSGVQYQTQITPDPVETITKQSADYDLLIIGSTARPVKPPAALGPVVDRILNESSCPIVVVKAAGAVPTQFTGPEAEHVGQEAISLLVDKWFAENTYHSGEFDHLEHLLALKQAQNLTISLALPALNEEATVGTVIRTIQYALMKQVPLLDEIVLIDSNSTDRTREIARDLGVPVYIHQEILPEYGSRPGKGEALWKSLLVTRGDIVIWIDTDIVNIHPRFVYGVIGPLLADPKVSFVKGFYQRPLKSGELTQSTGGGRVTELTARPLINLFYPELSGVIQPLSGEYGGRREVLERLPFFSGYGVETGLLIDIFEKFGLSAIAQVDLFERIHHNQPLEALSKMSFAIIQSVLRKLEGRFNVSVLEEVNKSMKLIRYNEGGYSLEVQEVAERERPPMIEIQEYQALHPVGDAVK